MPHFQCETMKYVVLYQPQEETSEKKNEFMKEAPE